MSQEYICPSCKKEHPNKGLLAICVKTCAEKKEVERRIGRSPEEKDNQGEPGKLMDILKDVSISEPTIEELRKKIAAESCLCQQPGYYLTYHASEDREIDGVPVKEGDLIIKNAEGRELPVVVKRNKLLIENRHLPLEVVLYSSGKTVGLRLEGVLKRDGVLIEGCELIR